MIALKSLLAPLNRPDVAEVVLRGGKRPVARVGSAAEEIDGRALTADDLVQILFSAGGSRYVETLGDKPAQWRTRVEGVGAVVVSAAMHGEVMEARFALRDALPAATPPPQGTRQRPSSIPPVRARGGSRSARPPPASTRKLPRAAKTGDAPPSTKRGGSHPPAPDPPLTPRPPMASASEIDLEIGASEIPSVPSAGLDSLDHLDNPRTMPEARFTRPRDQIVTPIPRGSEPRVEVEPPPPRPTLPTIPSEIDVAAAFELDEPGLPSDEAPPARRLTPHEPSPGNAGGYPQTPGNAGGYPQTAGPVPMHRLDEPTVTHVTDAPLSPEPFAPSQRRPPIVPEARAPKRTTTGRTTRPFARDPHTLLWQKLLRAARDVRASDLHLAATRPPLYRIAGQIVARGEALDPLVVEDMILSRLPSRLTALFEAEGSCCFAIEDPELGRFRAGVSRHRAGIKASLRLVATQIPTLAGLGLPDSIGAVTHHRRGLIVIAGPAGHGKTATMAAIVGLLNRETPRHIVTIEDPIEHVHPRARALLSQREVGSHARSVEAALEAALRQDAEVIVVGELRDAGTARAALVASELGHLVITTMCAQSAARTIDRLVGFFPPGERPQARASLAGSLELIVSQRLLPDTEGKRVVAAAEVLPAMASLTALIREEDRTYQIPRLEQERRHLGAVRLDDALAELVRAGRVTAAAALAVADAPEEMEVQLGVKPPRATSPVRPLDPKTPMLGVPRPGQPAGSPSPEAKEKSFFDNIFRKKGD